jgi:hypothetical protein
MTRTELQNQQAAVTPSLVGSISTPSRHAFPPLFNFTITSHYHHPSFMRAGDNVYVS